MGDAHISRTLGAHNGRLQSHEVMLLPESPRHVVARNRNDDTERRKSDRGASAVEYALLIAGIAAVIIVSVSFVGKTVSGQFSEVGSSIASTK
jgi:pilus assembly protein Flp/PilA